MENRKPLIDEHGEVREITAEDVALFEPFSTLPKAERKMPGASPRIRGFRIETWGTRPLDYFFCRNLF